MKFIYRLSYFLGGLSIGLVILIFVLNKKNASCNYFPNDRVLSNIQKKKLFFSESVDSLFRLKKMDSTRVREVLNSGNVDFSRSDTKLKGCKNYIIVSEDETFEIKVVNCDEKAKIEEIKFLE